MPSNANSGQGDLFRAYLKSRLAFWALIAGSGVTFVIGAVKHALPVMMGGPVMTVVLVVGAAFFLADHAAAERFYSSFAGELGLAYSGRRTLPTLTPLLGAGDRRHADHWMEGALRGDLPLQGGLGHFTWEELQQKRDSKGALHTEVKERHTVTICGVGLEQSMARFRGVYLRPRRVGDNWLPKNLTRKIEVESAAFTERYDLRIANDMDEMRVRQLLAPTLVSWLAEHPLTPGFELKAGTLVVYTMRTLEDSGNLTYLIDATRHLAGRVLRELTEGGQETARTRPSRALAR